MANDNMNIKTAAKLLRNAREIIEYEAGRRVMYSGDKQDLQDAAEDIGPILLTLESFGG